MKHSVLTPLLGLFFAFCAPAHAADVAYSPKFYSIEDAGAAEAFAEEAKADFRASYGPDGKLDIMIGAITNGARTPISFSFDELVTFWEAHAKGKFVCVTLCKNNWDEKKVREAVSRITDHLFSCGVARVRIHQGLGGGVGVLSDRMNPVTNALKK